MSVVIGFDQNIISSEVSKEAQEGGNIHKLQPLRALNLVSSLIFGLYFLGFSLGKFEASYIHEYQNRLAENSIISVKTASAQPIVKKNIETKNLDLDPGWYVNVQEFERMKDAFSVSATLETQELNSKIQRAVQDKPVSYTHLTLPTSG